MESSSLSENSPFRGRNKPTNPVLNLGLSIRLIVLMGVFNLLLLIGMSFLLIKVNNIAEHKPWVIARTTMNELVDLQLDVYQLDRLAVEQYLQFTLSRLYLVENGESKGLEDIQYLIDSKIMTQHVATLQNKRSDMDTQGFNLQVSVTGLDLSSPETFVINHKTGRVYGTVYGSVIVQSSENSYHMDTKWEVECRIVSPTGRNRWGLLLTQLFEKSPENPVFVVPENLRKPGERVPWENSNERGF
jgi:hypothetical protein